MSKMKKKKFFWKYVLYETAKTLNRRKGALFILI